jgi:hypothetical protein
MTTASSARLGHDEIVVGCDFALDVILEPVAGQTAAEVSTALGVGCAAMVYLVDFDYAFDAEDPAETAIADLSEWAELDADTRTLSIAVDAATTTDLFEADGLAGTYAWRVVVTTSTGTGNLKWPVRMPRRVLVRP